MKSLKDVFESVFMMKYLMVDKVLMMDMKLLDIKYCMI